MRFKDLAAGVLAFCVFATPLVASADVYINVGSPGFFPWLVGKCQTYGQGVKCSESATGNGGTGVTFLASEPNGQCIGANPRQLPCITYTTCYVKIERTHGGSYDIVAVKSDVGEPSTSVPGGMSVSSAYKRTRKACTASWINSNTVVFHSDLLPIDRPAKQGVISCVITPAYQTWSKPATFWVMPAVHKGTTMTFYPPAFNGRLTNGTLWFDESCVKLGA